MQCQLFWITHLSGHSCFTEYGNTASIDEDMIDAGGWENVPMGFWETAQEGPVDLSHKGSEYFNFIDITQESFSR